MRTSCKHKTRAIWIFCTVRHNRVFSHEELVTLHDANDLLLSTANCHTGVTLAITVNSQYP